jgi:hypothetical protein
MPYVLLLADISLPDLSAEDGCGLLLVVDSESSSMCCQVGSCHWRLSRALNIPVLSSTENGGERKTTRTPYRRKTTLIILILAATEAKRCRKLRAYKFFLEKKVVGRFVCPFFAMLQINMKNSVRILLGCLFWRTQLWDITILGVLESFPYSAEEENIK